MQFHELNLIEPIRKALAARGYREATPIQVRAIPPLLAGHDLLGCAQTGTGKTAAFSVPILQNLQLHREPQSGKRTIKALVVAPTRELALQIGECFTAYGANLNLRTLVIFGGVGQQPQTRELERGIDILVATPGRLLDLMNQGFISLSRIQYFVLDEADHMLDMGMIHDVKRIIAHLPKERQTMFFSATMPPEIAALANTILHNPIKIEINPVRAPIDIIEQKVFFVDKENKTNLLTHLLREKEYESVLVFSRTKHGADKIVRELGKNGFASVAIHGNKSQTNRQLALGNFKERKIKILVATDIAARGLDIAELALVINYNLPEVPETYVHRIGRTGRAGLGGTAYSFCDFEEKALLSDIQKLIGKTLPVADSHPYPLVNTVIPPKGKPEGRPGAPRRNPPTPQPKAAPKDSFSRGGRPAPGRSTTDGSSIKTKSFRWPK